MVPSWPPEPALLQCPFCDGTPVWQDKRISCLHCGAVVCFDTSALYERQYIAGKWNRRVPRTISPKEKSLTKLVRLLVEVRKMPEMRLDISDALIALVEEVAKERAA